jgi:predicted nucleic acid-binding protein
VIFVDSNLFVYAVGRPHPLREEARAFFAAAGREGTPLATSAEVLQELLHIYLPVQRVETLDAALELAARSVDRVFPVESADVAQARTLLDEHPGLAARDLLHLAVCRRHGLAEIKTFDRGLQAAFKRRRRG